MAYYSGTQGLKGGCFIFLAIAFLLSGLIMTIYGYTASPFFDKSDSSFCDFCDDSYNTDVRNIKNTKIAGPIFLALGFILLVISIVYCKRAVQESTTGHVVGYSSTSTAQPMVTQQTYHQPNQAGYPPTQAPSYPQQAAPGYPPGVNIGYPPQPYPAQTTYPPPQTTYPPPQATYPPPQANYPPPQATYPPPQGAPMQQAAPYPPLSQPPYAPDAGMNKEKAGFPVTNTMLPPPPSYAAAASAPPPP